MLIYVIISESPETRLVPISIRAISMHKIESMECSNRKYLFKTILACRERQFNNLQNVSLLTRHAILITDYGLVMQSNILTNSLFVRTPSKHLDNWVFPSVLNQSSHFARNELKAMDGLLLFVYYMLLAPVNISVFI